MITILVSRTMLFVAQNQHRYIASAKETPGKCGYIDVFIKNGDEKYQRYWSFMPNPGYPPIFFLCVIQQHLLVVINQVGELRLFDLQLKQELATSKITGSIGLLGAGIYPSETKGFIVKTNPKQKGVDILEFDSNSLEINLKQTITGIHNINTITVLNESQLVGYVPTGSTDGINSSDGFLIIDTIKKSYKQHCLRPAPSGNFSQPPVAFDPRSKIGIRPSYDPIEIMTEKGDQTYLAKVMLFDLVTGKKIRNVTVREFSSTELFEDEDPGYALSCLELPPYSADYLDVKEEFLERFEAFRFCNQEDAFWVTFQHGFLRKISFEGKYKSPLIEHPGDPELHVNNRLSRTGFDTPLDISPDDRFLLFGLPTILLRTSNLVNHKTNTNLLISQNEDLECSCAEKSKNEIAFTWNVLEFDALDTRSAVVNALNILLDKTKEIDLLRDGSFFRFRFKSKSEVLSEAQFCQKVEWNEELYSIGRQILENLINYGESLWHDEATPALFSFMRILVLQKASHLDFLIRYVRLFGDCKSDRDNLKCLIDEVIEKYGWIQETIDLILTRACFQTENGLEQLEHYLQQPEFKAYQSNPAHSKYFQEHTLFRTLADEYFPLFHPAEDALFSAIETGDIKKLKQLLDKPLKLDLIHPEFNLNPLNLAIELDNREITDLLISAGAAPITHKPKEDLPISLNNIHQDISLNKAMRTLLNDLQNQQEVLQKEIYDLEFSHMLNFSLTAGQSALLESKNKELEEIQSQIKYANLGLLSLEDLTQSAESDNPLFLQQTNESEDSAGSDSYISDQSYAYEDHSANLIQAEDLTEKSQIYVFERMKELLDDTKSIILDQVLRFNFKIDGKITSEVSFFEAILLTAASAQKLAEFIQSLNSATTQSTWYDDEYPCGFYAIQKLVLFNQDYIEDFILYLKSGIIDKEEPVCITGLVFDVYDKYSWNTSTLLLAANRLCENQFSNGLSEFRIQWKKGGLEDFFRNIEIKETFLRLLVTYCNEERVDWFNQFINDKPR